MGSLTAMDRAIIEKRIALLMKCLDRLRAFAPISLDEYINKFDNQLIVERLIHQIVEIASDINSYLLVELHQTTPETYFDSFIDAGNKGIISRDLARELAKSAGMRNIIVHQYEDIDHRLVFAAIPKALDQYPRYLREITKYLNSLEAKNG
jgi:uncharacterized protein YutE (UPF0331/DUF86 family)